MAAVLLNCIFKMLGLWLGLWSTEIEFYRSATIRWTEWIDSYLIQLLPRVACEFREFREFLVIYIPVQKKKWSMNDEGDEGREISCRKRVKTHVWELFSCWNFPVTFSSGKYEVLEILASVMVNPMCCASFFISMFTCRIRASCVFF